MMDALDKGIGLFDYISNKIDKDRVLEFIAHFGLDQPHILATRSLDGLKALVDKIITIRRGLN